MQPLQYRLSNPNGWMTLREDFSYYDDGRLHQITDLDDTGPPPPYRNMSRSYTYDHVGRVLQAGGINQPSPFIQSYTYDEFDNLLSRGGAYGYYFSQSDSATYTNSKRDGWTYDADGRLTVSPANSVSNARTWQYDAAGRLLTTVETATSTNVQTTLVDAYDGDGEIIYNGVVGNPAQTFYLVRSSVLKGGVVTRLTSTGDKSITYVEAGGILAARQTKDYNNQPTVEWTHKDAIGLTDQGTTGLGGYDPLGNYASLPPPPPTGGGYTAPGGSYGPSYSSFPSSFTNFNNFSTGCLMDGRPIDCNRAAHYIDDGIAVPCPNNNCGAQNINGQLSFFDPGATNVQSNGLGMFSATYNWGEDLGIVGQEWDPESNGYLDRTAGNSNTTTEYFFFPLGDESFNEHAPQTTPQETKPKQFKDQYLRCGEQVFGAALVDAPSRAASSIIPGVAQMEGVDPALLAVTWRFESGFALNPDSNPNDGRPGNADIGPIQINYRTWHSWSGLNGLDDVFGTTTTGKEVFNGNALSNVRAGARILNSLGSGRSAAGLYRTGTGNFSKTKAGIAEFNKRAGLYDQYAPKYAAFFKCLEK